MINKSIQKKIHKMVKKDQLMRKSGKFDKNTDIENTKKLKKIIYKYGWPDIDLVGKKASHGAWLIAQHADHNVRFQEKCLKLLKNKLKENKVSSQEIAYLTDRIRVNKNLPQIYGTQFYLNKKKGFTHSPIKDRKNLDKRREKFNLESFFEYKKRLTKTYKKFNR